MTERKLGKQKAASADSAFDRLRRLADGLSFRPHRIRDLLDAEGRHREELTADFPFLIRLFHQSSESHSSMLTWHERLELIMPIDGPCRERMGDGIFDLAPGDLLVVDNLTLHQVVDFSGFDTRMIVITFMPELIYSLQSMSSDHVFLAPFYHRKGLCVSHTHPRADAIYESIIQILSAYFLGGEPTRMQTGVRAWFLVLLHHLGEVSKLDLASQKDIRKRQDDERRLRKVLERVRLDPANPPSLDSAAKLSGMSKAQFGRVFKRTVGVTLSAYTNRVRLSNAVALLESTPGSMAEIALQLGFCDQSHFDRRFKQAFRQTPSEYRASLRRLAAGEK